MKEKSKEGKVGLGQTRRRRGEDCFENTRIKLEEPERRRREGEEQCNE